MAQKIHSLVNTRKQFNYFLADIEYNMSRRSLQNIEQTSTFTKIYFYSSDTSRWKSYVWKRDPA